MVAGGDSEEDEVVKEEAPPTKQAATPSKPTGSSDVSDGCRLDQSSHLPLQVAAISERLAMYDSAIREAKGKGESSKVRRYTRAMETIKTLQKKVCKNCKSLTPYFPLTAPHTALPPGSKWKDSELGRAPTTSVLRGRGWGAPAECHCPPIPEGDK